MTLDISHLKLKNFMDNIIKPGKYQHYKGGLYEVLGLAHHSETLEELVVYRALYDSPEFGPNALWVRPAKMFLEEIELPAQGGSALGGKVKKVPRFKFINESK